MDKTFLSDYYHEKDIWKIYTLNEDNSLKYFNISNKNNVDEKKLNLPNPTCINCENMSLSNKMLYSMMNDNTMEFLNVNDCKFYKVYNIFFNYKDCPVILYYCNNDDPFIVVQTTSYMNFQNIFYINRKEIIQISKNQESMYYFNEIIDTINFVKKNEQQPIIDTFKKYIFFGFNMNIGHHLWNELSGLYYFLENKDYHDKIDGIIIGPFDFFNTENILKEKYNFDILKFTDIFQECRHYYFKNLKNCFPIALNTFYIDKNIKNLFDNNIINDDDAINDHDDGNDNILEISINIRTFRRYLINQDIFYIKLINNLLEDYKEYKIKINFLGCFKSHNISFSEQINTECIEQTKIVNNIIEKFNKNKNLIFKNLIGEYFFTIKNKTIKSKIFIASFGTSVGNLINWIYNKKVIVFGPAEAYEWSDIQFKTLQNYNAIYSPKEYTLTNNGLQEPFDIDFNLYYDFLKNYIDSII